jgi:hypothetical protein
MQRQPLGTRSVNIQSRGPELSAYVRGKIKTASDFGVQIVLFPRPTKFQNLQSKAPSLLTLYGSMASLYHALDGPKHTIYAMKGILFDMFDYILNARTQTFEQHALLLHVTTPFELSFTNMELRIGVQKSALFLGRNTQL